MKTELSWVPFYIELAAKLLRYKDDRKALTDWIYSELSSVKGDSGNSLINYLREEDGSRVNDIDPFSVFAIFNRNTKWERRTDFLKLFKDHFDVEAELPSDYIGVPTVDSRRAFFFHWDFSRKNEIQDQWNLFEKVVDNEDPEDCFNKVISNGMAKYSLTMVLYWIAPNRFMSLDSSTRDYIQLYGLPGDFPDLKYDKYADIMRLVTTKMAEGVIPCQSYSELSFAAYTARSAEKVWMFNGDETTFKNDVLAMGSSAQGKLDFASFNNKEELGNAYRVKVSSNTDVRVPDMYWKFMKDIQVGDTVVIFQTRKDGRNQYHLLYGWGRFTSDCEIDLTKENPLCRMVEWNENRPFEPVKETRTSNSLWLHSVSGIDAFNIRRLLNIGNEINTKSNMETRDKNQLYIDLLKSNYNLILTGAPGTGKTHLAKEIAREMLGLEDVSELGADKHFCFVQLHPSYDYTDFVEGLRPKSDENNTIGFERKDGVFKEFCKRAIISRSTDKEVFGDLNDNPTVWKVSLERTGDNPTRKDCMDNGYIRIGWCEYGDIDDFDDFSDFDHGGKNVLRAFQSSMQIGDIVLSCYSAKEIDAVGVITGDYEYRQDSGVFPRFRTVKWLVKGIKENIVDLNKGKPFTLATVYRASISAEEALGIVRKYKSNLVKTEEPFVFIIDEINRGENSKIFGELFYSIDPGYRGEKGRVQTQYQNLVREGDIFKNGFYVPENVYIIGTMNDIDRSVESMDFAMRRRFAWKEVSAKDSYDAMKDDMINAVEVGRRMAALNKAIAETSGLNESYQIGAAYYLKLKEYNGDFDKLWNNHLKGLLYEYLRGNRNADKELERWENAYNGTTELKADDKG